MLSKAQHAAAACNAGVPRVHVINGTLDEGLLGEVFSNHGLGTLIYANEYEHIRPAKKKDVRAIQLLTKQAVEADELVKRTKATIEKSLGDYFIFEIDKNPVACVALHVYPEQNQGELACLYVSSSHENQGIGRKLIQFVERPGPRTGPAGAAGALDAGVHLLSVQGRLRRRHARRPAARAPREVRAERPELEGAREEAQLTTGSPDRMLTFSHRILFVGFGAVARCTLPILLKHINVDPKRITIMDFEPDEAALKPWIEQGMTLRQEPRRRRRTWARSSASISRPATC